MKVSFRDPKNYITVSVPSIGFDVYVDAISLFGRGDDLCRANWQLTAVGSFCFWERDRPTKKEGHASCPYAFTRLQKNLDLITSNCLIFATK